MDRKSEEKILKLVSWLDVNHHVRVLAKMEALGIIRFVPGDGKNLDRYVVVK